MPIEAVLSDSNKRLLYDVGIHDSEDDEADVTTRPNSNLIIFYFPGQSVFLTGFGQGNSIADGFFLPFASSAAVGDGRLPRRDGRHDEPGHANGKARTRPAAEHLDRPSRVEIRALTESIRVGAGDLRGAAAGVRGHVPGRPGRRRVLRRASDDAPQRPGTGQHLVAAGGVVIVAVAADACWKKQGGAGTVVVV